MTRQFAADPTSSNKAGVTLMNNQVGYEVAEVMRGKENVTVTELPSMIRVDGVNKVDFDFEEIADALGWADFGQDDFEEIMSTHYGRMVVLDDRVLLFANPEDAAEYLGFDLAAGAVAPGEESRCTRRTASSTTSSTATCTSGTRARRTGSRAPRSTPRAGSSASTPTRASGPPDTHWTIEHFQKYSADDFEKDVFRGRRRRQGGLPVDVPEGVVHERASTTSSRTPRCWTASTAS